LGKVAAAERVIPLAVWPTATHGPPLGQARPATAVKLGGADPVVQVEPPSALVRKTGALAPVAVAPEAEQAVGDAQETSKTEAEPAGSVTTLKVAPPSVVSTASPGAVGFC
jgi:hypothetical protein